MNRPGAARLLATFAVATAALWAAPLRPTLAAEDRTVKLPNGRTFQVTLIYNQVPLFSNSKVKMLSIGLIQSSAPDANPPGVRWRFEFELSGNHNYEITIRSPLDDTIEARVGGAGPGTVVHEVLPCTEFPALCYWSTEEAGGAFVPFHFTFRNRKSGREFSFMQWCRVTPWDKAFFKALDESRQK